MKKQYTNEEKIKFYEAKIKAIKEKQDLLTPVEVDAILLEILQRVQDIEKNTKKPPK